MKENDMAENKSNRSYYRVMLGKGSMHADECFKGNFIGSGYAGIMTDQSHKLMEDYSKFREHFFQEVALIRPEKSKVAIGLWCSFAWTICKGIQIGDIILSPDGKGIYRIGEITGNYYYVDDGNLPHRRKIEWFENQIARSEMGQSLQNSTGSIGTVSNITKYANEIESFLGTVIPADSVEANLLIDDSSVFALEKHLEEFLVHNWSATELGKNYDIFQEDGEIVGQQYPTDTGNMDILALSKDGKTLLIVELKKGRANDVVVGQVQRYMGYAIEELAEPGQTVRGCIIALDDDLRLRRTLRVATNIDFYRYKVNFSLFKQD